MRHLHLVCRVPSEEPDTLTYRRDDDEVLVLQRGSWTRWEWTVGVSAAPTPAFEERFHPTLTTALPVVDWWLNHGR